MSNQNSINFHVAISGRSRRKFGPAEFHKLAKDLEILARRLARFSSSCTLLDVLLSIMQEIKSKFEVAFEPLIIGNRIIAEFIIHVWKLPRMK